MYRDMVVNAVHTSSHTVVFTYYTTVVGALLSLQVGKWCLGRPKERDSGDMSAIFVYTCLIDEQRYIVMVI